MVGCSADYGLFILKVLAFCIFFLAEVHGFALDDLAFGGTDHGILHVQHHTHRVNEDGRGRVHDARHQRGLDELKVELLGCVVAEHRARMGEVNLEVVLDAEGLGEDALRG